MKFLSPFILFLNLAVFSFGQSFDSYRPLKDTTVQATQLGYKKHLQITVPKAYQNGAAQQFPLIVIFDMQNQTNYKYILHSIDYLTTSGQMPAAVIVGIDAGEGARRWRETQLAELFPGMQAEQNDDYLFKSLIPMARQDYKASDFTVLIGHSRYGFFTSYLLAKHLTQLNAVLSLSPFFEQSNNELHKKLDVLQLLTNATKTTPLNHTVYYRFCMGNDYPDDYKRMDSAISKNAFQNKNFNVKGELFPDADHLSTPGLSVSKALYEVFAYWNTKQSAYLKQTELNAAIINNYHSDVKKHYGTDVSFSLSYLNGTGWAFYNKEKYETAILAWQQLTLYYPNFSEAYLCIAKCQKKLNQPVDATLKQFKESLTTSTYFDAKKKEALLKEAEGL